MRATGKLRFVKPRLGEQRAHRADMGIIAAMRSASDGELRLPEAEGVGGTALYQRYGLQGLDGRTRIDRAFDIAEPKQHASVSIGDGHGAAVAALNQPSARHFNQNGIVLHGFAHAAAIATGARLAPHRPGSASNSTGQGSPHAAQSP